MKVLSINAGYFLGYSGTHIDYVKHPARSVIGSGREEEYLQQFLDLVDSHDPDLVMVQEVDGGSIRTSTDSQHGYLEERLDGYSSLFGTKYRGTVTPRLPMLRRLGNSVFYREGDARNHSLGIGRKNLVQEIELGDRSFFSVHLSTFWNRIRKEQLREIKQIPETDDYLLAGDLNFHKGDKEIRDLEKMNGWKVSSPGKTFPASDPRQKLDLVATSGSLEVRNLRRLENTFTDHRPMTFSVE